MKGFVQAGSEEDHVRTLEKLQYSIRVLECRFASDFWVATGTEPSGQADSELDLGLRLALAQSLKISVTGNELDASHVGVDHPVDGVAATATDSDDLDPGGQHVGIFERDRQLALHLSVVKKNHPWISSSRVLFPVSK
jgi:hypothetical protein